MLFLETRSAITSDVIAKGTYDSKKNQNGIKTAQLFIGLIGLIGFIGCGACKQSDPLNGVLADEVRTRHVFDRSAPAGQKDALDWRAQLSSTQLHDAIDAQR